MENIVYTKDKKNELVSNLNKCISELNNISGNINRMKLPSSFTGVYLYQTLRNDCVNNKSYLNKYKNDLCNYINELDLIERDLNSKVNKIDIRVPETFN